MVFFVLDVCIRELYCFNFVFSLINRNIRQKRNMYESYTSYY